jgi:hypothetical protein
MDVRATTTLFLRDDDIGQLTPAALEFIGLFRSRGIPVSYQVIPAHLTDECATFLRNFHRDKPGLVEIGQHGLEHEMHIGGRRLSWEFGRELDYATQRAVIAEGRRIMTAKLGAAFDGRMFTPPRHRFNADTVRAAADEGFSIFSAAAYADGPRRLVYAIAKALRLGTLGNRGVAYHPGSRPEASIRELSIAIAVDNGPPRSRRVADLLGQIDRAASVSPIVGLMFHHAAWGTQDGARFLGELADALLGRRDTRIALPRDIVAE